MLACMQEFECTFLFNLYLSYIYNYHDLTHILLNIGESILCTSRVNHFVFLFLFFFAVVVSKLVASLLSCSMSATLDHGKTYERVSKDVHEWLCQGHNYRYLLPREIILLFTLIYCILNLSFSVVVSLGSTVGIFSSNLVLLLHLARTIF